MNILGRKKYVTACTVEVSQTRDAFHAHVVLDDGFIAQAGDRVCIRGGPIGIEFGQCVTERRMAEVQVATWLERLWVKAISRFEFHELYEVSFTSRSTL